MTFSNHQDSNVQPSLTGNEKLAANESESGRSPQYHPGDVEFSAQLENSVPLEAPRFVYGLPSPLPAPEPMVNEVIDPVPQASLGESQSNRGELSSTSGSQALQSAPVAQVSEQTTIQLLAERLIVDLHRRKVGEVVVRKEIETRIVEVPVRREKLVVEQISPDYQQLAIVDLGQSQNSEFDAAEVVQLTDGLTVSGKFNSTDAAIQFLQAIAAQFGSNSQMVQISIIPQNSGSRAVYERMLEQHSHNSIV